MVFILFGLSVCGRVEDKIAEQQSEVCEGSIPGNVEQSREDHIGKRHCRSLTLSGRLLNTSLSHLGTIISHHSSILKWA